MARATKKNSSGVPLCRMPTVSRELGDSGQRMPAYEANIAAIDFGTTYCSLAFKTRGDLGETVVRLDGANQRVPNAILLKIEKEESICMVCKEAQCADKQQSCTKAAAEMVTKQYICKVRSFGDLAQVNYQRLRKNEYSNHFYFERVKIGLMQKVRQYTVYNFYSVIVIKLWPRVVYMYMGARRSRVVYQIARACKYHRPQEAIVQQVCTMASL